MVFGIQTDVFEDTKSRKIFHVKTKDTYYLLQQDFEFKVRLLRMNSIDSISIAVLLSLFIKLSIYFYAGIAAGIYIAYLFYFNTNVLTKMQQIKKVKRKAKSKDTKYKKPPFVAFAYIFVGLGLVYCILTNQVEAGTMTLVVIGAIAVSLGLGSFYLWIHFVR